MADHTATPPTCDLRWATWEMELQRSPIHPIPTSQESDITPPWATIQCGHDTTGMIWDANSSSTAAVKSARLKSCTAVCQVCHEKMKSTPLSQVSIAANSSYFAWPQAHTIGNTLCRPLAHRCGNDVAAPVATAALLGLAQLDPSRMSTSMSIHVSSFFHPIPELSRNYSHPAFQGFCFHIWRFRWSLLWRWSFCLKQGKPRSKDDSNQK